MYLPNSDLHPSGAEVAEFIEAHQSGQPGDRLGSGPGATADHRHTPTTHLDTQTRIDIARRAEEYISGLVERHHGDRQDVRAVIHDLDHQANVVDRHGRAPLV